MEVFHGTDLNSAKNIVGSPANVDITKGGGELGRGFYVSESRGMVSSWAHERYGFQAKVIKFTIDDTKFDKMKIFFIKRRSILTRLRKSFIKKSLFYTFLFGVDVVDAPMASIEGRTQYKFESHNSQTLINNSSNSIL